MKESSGTGRGRAISRRALLASAAGAAGVAMLENVQPGLAATTLVPATKPPDSQEPSQVQGRPPSELGTRAPGEQPRRLPSPTSSRTPLHDLHGTITPADLHFERHHAGVPTIDPATYSLLIHGLVERPTVFSLDDVRRFPSETHVHFLECAGNLARGAGEQTTPQQLCGLTSQTEWTGVPLATVFREVGVLLTAKWFLAEGGDAALLARSIPVDKAFDDAMLAWAQNGEALRPEQGYPVRLLLPGWEGNSNVKWLRRIELADRPFMTREETAKYTEPLKDGTVRQFSFVIDARSIITYPTFPARVRPGWIEITGIAWSGRGRITGVDLSTDGGRTWVPAGLQEPVLSKAHTRFRLMWNWSGEETVIESRATDETGYVQPTRARLIEARGAGAVPYHLNPVTGWRIRADGQVVFRAEPWG
jgi:sulfane dehydrogenase subunit SoxC